MRAARIVASVSKGMAVSSRTRSAGALIRLDARDPLLDLPAEPHELVVAEDVETRHDVDEVADVLDHRVAEHERLAVPVLLQTVRDAFDRLAEPPVEIAHRIVELLLDVALDVALDPIGVVAGELGDEVLRVRHRGDAVADGELALERLLRGVVLDAEELAEVEPGLVDVVVVVLDEAGALAHHALAQAVHEPGAGAPPQKHENSAKLSCSPLASAAKARRCSSVMLVVMAIPVWTAYGAGTARRARSGPTGLDRPGPRAPSSRREAGAGEVRRFGQNRMGGPSALRSRAGRIRGGAGVWTARLVASWAREVRPGARARCGP